MEAEAAVRAAVQEAARGLDPKTAHHAADDPTLPPLDSKAAAK